jgi:hypothetical protein
VETPMPGGEDEDVCAFEIGACGGLDGVHVRFQG